MNIFNPMQDIVTVDEGAQNHFQKIIQKENAQGIRLTLKPSGCAGFSYVWEIIDEVNNEDIIIFNSLFKLTTNRESMGFLQNSIIRLQENIAGGQVIVESPQAENSCGCGESVSFKL
jgi:iron-sulfur cluster assembly accessory protein